MVIKINKLNSSRLFEVDILRIILIIILLVDHAFAPFGEIWEPVINQSDNVIYEYISQISSSLFLQIFVFISGYIYGMKCLQINNYDYKREIYRKFTRLIIPSIFFSFFYFIIFEDNKLQITEIIYNIVNGYGHLWFLPMLFWCFVLTILFEHYKISSTYALPLSLFLSLLSFIPLPFRLTQSFCFFFYFYIGFIIQKKNINLNRFADYYIISSFMILYLLCFISSKQVRITGFNEDLVLSHASRIVVNNIVRLFYSILGLSSLYFLSVKLSKKLARRNQVAIYYMASYCFGIYIYQQFLLKYFYYEIYKGQFSILFLPWIGLIVAGLGSALLTFFTLKFPYGRKLIG